MDTREESKTTAHRFGFLACWRSKDPPLGLSILGTSEAAFADNTEEAPDDRGIARGFSDWSMAGQIRHSHRTDEPLQFLPWEVSVRHEDPDR